jgi:hypothetical protein
MLKTNPTASSSRRAAPPCAASRSSSPALVRALVRDYLERAREGEAIPEDPLTDRESEIVKLIAEGHSSRDIAETLVLSKKTVERHRRTSSTSSACATGHPHALGDTPRSARALTDSRRQPRPASRRDSAALAPQVPLRDRLARDAAQAFGTTACAAAL